MPYTAYHDESDDIHFVSQADPEGGYRCIDCKVPVSYVRSHKRSNSDGSNSQVDAHFRYYQCAHGTVDDVSEGAGGGGGGGGGGESDLHKRRKRAALQEALNRYPAADYGTEVPIGSKRADALLRFEDGHPEYGKGLVIEYQHKNESKEIEATQKHFAKHGYTTIWLWEDQYSFTSSIPEIDLFGGQVYTPWPDVVPEMGQWAPRGEYYELRNKWRRAYDLGLTDSTAEATIYKHWVRPTPQEHWKDSPWLDRFPDENHPTTRNYILQVAVGDRNTSIRVPATIKKDWVVPTRREHWESEPWFRRFTSTHHYPADIYIDTEQRNSETKLRAEVPFARWIREAEGERPEQIVGELYIAHSEGKTDPPPTQKQKEKALNTVESVVRHNSSPTSGISLRAILTVASSYIGIPSDHVRWAVNDLRYQGVLDVDNGKYRAST